MKRIIALLLVLAAGKTMFAQDRRYDDRNRQIILGDNSRSSNDRNYGNSRVYNDGYFSARERDLAIQRIDREYDSRIRWISSDRRLSNRERKRAIRELEARKREDIRQINERFYRQRSNSGYGQGRSRY